MIMQNKALIIRQCFIIINKQPIMCMLVNSENVFLKKELSNLISIFLHHKIAMKQVPESVFNIHFFFKTYS